MKPHRVGLFCLWRFFIIWGKWRLCVQIPHVIEHWGRQTEMRVPLHCRITQQCAALSLTLFLCVCLSIYPSIYLSIYLSFCVSVFLFVVCFSVFLSIYLYIYLSIRISNYLFICVSVCLCVSVY